MNTAAAATRIQAQRRPASRTCDGSTAAATRGHARQSVRTSEYVVVDVPQLRHRSMPRFTSTVRSMPCRYACTSSFASPHFSAMHATHSGRAQIRTAISAPRAAVDSAVVTHPFRPGCGAAPPYTAGAARRGRAESAPLRRRTACHRPRTAVTEWFGRGPLSPCKNVAAHGGTVQLGRPRRRTQGNPEIRLRAARGPGCAPSLPRASPAGTA